MDPIDTGPHYKRERPQEMEDFDPLDPVPAGAILTENQAEVSVDAEPELVGKSGTASTEILGIEPTWRLTWKHGTMDLILAKSSEAEARASAALFIKLWKRLHGWSPGLLRDMAVIYVSRCFRVHEMNLASAEFLAEVAKLDTPDTANKMYDKIYSLHKLLHAGKFEQVNFLLRDFDVKGRTTMAALGFLGFTNIVKEALSARASLYERAYAKALAEEGKEKADREFLGLK